MLPTPLSALIGVLFVLLAVGAVWLMFDGSRSAPQSDRARRMFRAHRVAGYLFIALFCIMTWFMILKIKDRPDELPAPSMLHALIAVVMAPLLFIKVLVARYYRNHTSILVPLGLTIFVLAFVLVTTTAGPYFLRTATVKNISLQAIDMGVAKIDLQASEALMQRRCSRCHNLDRVVGAKKDARAWLATVDRMRGLPGSGISESDEKIILSYLLSEDSINSSSAQGELVIGKALVDSHCNRCHALDRTYQTVQTASEWNSTVTRMVNAYSILVNHGRALNPSLIDFVQDRRGNVIWPENWRACDRCNAPDWDGKPMPRPVIRARQVVEAMSAYQMVHIAEGVIQRGTATVLRDLNRPMMGKTGTTSGPTDVWFVGGTPQMIAGLYLGYDTPSNLGGYAQGGVIAAPIFKQFAIPAYEGLEKLPFTAPAGIRMVRVDRASGKRVFGGWPSNDPKAAVIWEAFKPESEPRRGRQEEEAPKAEAKKTERHDDPGDSEFLQREGGIY